MLGVKEQKFEIDDEVRLSGDVKEVDTTFLGGDDRELYFMQERTDGSLSVLVIPRDNLDIVKNGLRVRDKTRGGILFYGNESEMRELRTNLKFGGTLLRPYRGPVYDY